MSIARSVSRMLARNGRPMTLRRRVGTALTTFNSATVTGFLVSFAPQEVVGLVQQGDARVTITPNVGTTLSAPRENDSLLVDGKAWRVMGAQPLYAGATLTGWRLWVRGGAT
jgi:hypothetical protein